MKIIEKVICDICGEKIKEDEEELLSFGYGWIRFNLFAEDTLKLKDKEMDKLLQSKRGKQ